MKTYRMFLYESPIIVLVSLENRKNNPGFKIWLGLFPDNFPYKVANIALPDIETGFSEIIPHPDFEEFLRGKGIISNALRKVKYKKRNFSICTLFNENSWVEGISEKELKSLRSIQDATKLNSISEEDATRLSSDMPF